MVVLELEQEDENRLNFPERSKGAMFAIPVQGLSHPALQAREDPLVNTVLRSTS